MISNLDDLIIYLVDNGLTDEEANHLLHKKFISLEYKSLMQLVRYGEWKMVNDFAEKYMLGEQLK